jgi:hypothetical protein
VSSTTLILIAGCTVFAVTTLAALWTGYLLLQHLWVTENSDLTYEDDAIRPLLAEVYPEQRGRRRLPRRDGSKGSATP